MDVILFQVCGRCCAFPIERVREVLEPLELTKLPFCPGFVDGLINISGQVILQIDLGLRLGLTKPGNLSRSFLLLIEVGSESYALQIDCVLARTQIDAHLLQAFETEDMVLKPIVSAEFFVENQSVWLLNPEAMGFSDIIASDVLIGTDGLLAMAENLDRLPIDPEQAYLLMQIGSEQYALALKQIIEVGEMTKLTHLADAPKEILGLMHLRGLPLLVLALAHLLGFECETAHNVIVIEHEGKPLGLAVSHLIGIRRFAENSIRPVESSAIKGYRLGLNDNLIGILSIPGLIDSGNQSAYRSFRDLTQSNETRSIEHQKERLLIIHLGDELFAIPLVFVISIEEGLNPTPVSSVELSMIGALQIQGDVLPVIDLAKKLGLNLCRESRVANSFVSLGERDGVRKPFGANGAPWESKVPAWKPVASLFFVVVELEGARWVVKIDKPERVIEVLSSDLDPIGTHQTGHLSAVGKLDGKLYAVLHLKNLLE